MSQRRKAGDIALKRAGSGFIMRSGYVQIDPEAWPEQYYSYRYWHEDDEPHRPPCCHDPDCQEWSDLRMLPGATLARRRKTCGAEISRE